MEKGDYMRSKLIRNGLLIDIENGHVNKYDILIENGKIKKISDKIFYEKDYLKGKRSR